LEFGEGTIDCLKRECIEEMNQPVEIVNHFYTTDFYLESVFKKTDQLLSIYYRMQPVGEINFSTSDQPFNFNDPQNDIVFRWVPIQSLSNGVLRFPVDLKVAQMLQTQLG